MDVFTPEEIRRLLDAQEEPLRTLLLAAALSGMRQGELFGLLWKDIDFAAHVIHVRRALWRGTLGTPKSQRFRRAIDMPPTLEAALRRLSATRRSEFVFCSERGTPIDADNFRHREFPQALRRAGLRRVRFHDLRHTYTSLLIAHGAHPKYIQAQLGHASIQRRSTATAISCRSSTRRRRRSSTSWSLAARSRRQPAGSRRYASDGRRVGAKWEQSPTQRKTMGAKWEQKTRKG